ncbi:hypothetical protein HYH03_018012 [Edaphochlamys debaryana]|uniref:Cyclin-like domain-containing protein n=1 Tax=Edaphochlamys debaryana TaxID=47281 RepID=A0A835XEM7_9CHLO|nr:hypothetical protein HYH03_018012 [Edaphochlamys debaryana]|eukprot:KAG2483122.1 hypothetical protein HYH03_018012 [Edaphochlamys debaryana]
MQQPKAGGCAGLTSRASSPEVASAVGRDTSGVNGGSPSDGTALKRRPGILHGVAASAGRRRTDFESTEAARGLRNELQRQHEAWSRRRQEQPGLGLGDPSPRSASPSGPGGAPAHASSIASIADPATETCVTPPAAVPEAVQVRTQDDHGLVRGVVVDWMAEVVTTLQLSTATLFGAVALYDSFMEQQTTLRPPQSILQLLAITCLALTSRQQEGQRSLTQAEWLALAADPTTGAPLYLPEDIRRMEWLLLETVEWRLAPPTAYAFLQRLLHCLDADEWTACRCGLGAEGSPDARQLFKATASFVTELALPCDVARRFTHSTVAAASIAVALHATHAAPQLQALRLGATSDAQLQPPVLSAAGSASLDASPPALGARAASVSPRTPDVATTQPARLIGGVAASASAAATAAAAAAAAAASVPAAADTLRSSSDASSLALTSTTLTLDSRASWSTIASDGTATIHTGGGDRGAGTAAGEGSASPTTGRPRVLTLFESGSSSDLEPRSRRHRQHRRQEVAATVLEALASAFGVDSSLLAPDLGPCVEALGALLDRTVRAARAEAGGPALAGSGWAAEPAADGQGLEAAQDFAHQMLIDWEDGEEEAGEEVPAAAAAAAPKAPSPPVSQVLMARHRGVLGRLVQAA